MYAFPMETHFSCNVVLELDMVMKILPKNADLAWNDCVGLTGLLDRLKSVRASPVF